MQIPLGIGIYTNDVYPLKILLHSERISWTSALEVVWRLVRRCEGKVRKTGQRTFFFSNENMFVVHPRVSSSQSLSRKHFAWRIGNLCWCSRMLLISLDVFGWHVACGHVLSKTPLRTGSTSELAWVPLGSHFSPMAPMQAVKIRASNGIFMRYKCIIVIMLMRASSLSQACIVIIKI